MKKFAYGCFIIGLASCSQNQEEPSLQDVLAKGRWIDLTCDFSDKTLYWPNNPNWYFPTGNKADIYKLARQSYFAEEDNGFSKDSTGFLHTEHLILVAKYHRIRGIYNGTLALEMQQLLQDIKMLESGD